MPLIQPVEKTLDIISAINSGNEKEAASQLGMTCNGSVEGDSFLAKVVAVAGSASGYHNGGVLVTPDSKSISNKELVSDALELSYALTESVSMIVANSLSALSLLTEDSDVPSQDDSNNTEPNDASINQTQMDTIKQNASDGLNTMKDALVDVFANTSKLNIKATELIKKSLADAGSSKELYVGLVSNAITSAGILYGISKISDYKNSNETNISEALNTSNITERADDIMFSTLDLQENLIKLYMTMSKFNNQASALLEAVEAPSADSGDPLSNGSEFIATAIDQVAKPLVNGQSKLSSEVQSIFDKVIVCIASLYDEYLQDFCAANAAA